MTGPAAPGGLTPTATALPIGARRPAWQPGWQQRTASGWRRDLRTSLLLLVCLLAWDASGLDLVVVRWYGDAGGFAWRDHWFTRDLLHGGGRWLAFLALAVLVVNLRWSVLGPRGPGEPLDRRARWQGLLLTLACLLAVPTLKQFSLSSCPWSLAEFGGVARYVSHWQFGVADGGSGHCFPSGHATSAFAFLGGYMMLRGSHPVAARRWLFGVLVFGLVFGWAQLARGAHYPSHSLWSAWLCWVICCAGHACWPRHGPTG